MCGSPYSKKFHYPTCPECGEHKILSPKHIRCRYCRARRNLRKVHAAGNIKVADK